MIRPLVAIGAVVVLAFVAEATSTEYDHDYKMKEHVAYARTYKHEPEYYEEEYHEPTKEKYDSYGKSYGSYRHKRQAADGIREANQFPGLFTPFGGMPAPGGGGFPAVWGGGF